MPGTAQKIQAIKTRVNQIRGERRGRLNPIKPGSQPAMMIIGQKEYSKRKNAKASPLHRTFVIIIPCVQHVEAVHKSARKLISLLDFTIMLNSNGDQLSNITQF